MYTYGSELGQLGFVISGIDFVACSSSGHYVANVWSTRSSETHSVKFQRSGKYFPTKRAFENGSATRMTFRPGLNHCCDS